MERHESRDARNAWMDAAPLGESNRDDNGNGEISIPIISAKKTVKKIANNHSLR